MLLILLWGNDIIAPMDDPRVLRIITVGLVLAALAVVYFLLTGGFAVSKSKKVQTQATQTNYVVESPSPSVSNPSASVSPLPAIRSAATQSAYLRILNRTQSGVQTLPNTGFPVGLAVVFSVGTMISGLSLRKFPH